MIDMKPMTLYELLSLLVSIGGFLTVIVSIYYLTQQTRYTAILLKETLIAPLDDQQIELTKLFIEYPEFRKYFYDGVAIDFNDENKNAQIVAVAEYILDYFAAIIFQKLVYKGVVNIPYWTQFIRDSFAKSPILCTTLETYKDWYPQELHRLKEEALSGKTNASLNSQNVQRNVNPGLQLRNKRFDK